MNILLIHPKLSETSSPRFPLGLGYIAAVLRNAGHSLAVIDLNAQKESDSELEKRIRAGKFDMIALRAMITQFKQTKILASLINSVSKAKIVLGGGLGSAVPEFVLKETDVDIIVVGEGEKTAVEVAERIENQKSLAGQNGIVYRDNGNIIKTSPQSYIEDISSIPFPAWDLFPMGRYFQRAEMGFPKRKISIITSRGCPYHCSFCFHGIFGYNYRFRSAENIIEEIKILKMDYGVQGICFEDDTFFLVKNRILKLCDMLRSHNVDIAWTCSGRVNLVDRELLMKMKASGCTHISYGIESGCQEMLNKIGKNITIEQAERAIKDTWDCGIIPHGFMMIGHSGETIASIQKSIEFCKKVGIVAEFSITTPIPGTKLFNEALEFNRIKSIKELIVRWEHWFEDVVVNMTDFTDSQLIEMKKKAEKEVFINFLYRKQRYYLKMLLLELRINGFISVINRMLRGIRLLVYVTRNRGLSGIRRK